MKWYGLTLFLLVGFVWSASAQQIDPQLVGIWESTDGPCNPCTLTIQENGAIGFAQAGSEIQIVFSNYTPAPGIDLVFRRGDRVEVSLSTSNMLVGFYIRTSLAERFVLVTFQRR
jgi:hypothetical protein